MVGAPQLRSRELFLSYYEMKLICGAPCNYLGEVTSHACTTHHDKCSEAEAGRQAACLFDIVGRIGLEASEFSSKAANNLGILFLFFVVALLLKESGTYASSHADSIVRERLYLTTS